MHLFRSKLALGMLACAALLAMPLAAAPADDQPVTYIVTHRDTLDGLAYRYLIGPAAARQVQARNHIRDPRRIPVGTRLSIPRNLLRSVPIELRVATFSGAVSLRPPGGAAMPVQAGAVLAEGSELITGGNGFVTLSGSDGSRISLPSQSHVRVGEARRYLINRAASIDIEVLRGRADVSAAKQQPEGRFRLRTPVSVSAVRGTQFRIGFAEDRAAGTTEVLEGLVGVATGNAALDLPRGFGAAASASGLAKEALLPAPEAIAPGRVQTDPEVSFALQPVAGAAGYRVQLARDAGFVDIIAEQSSVAPAAAFTGIADGRWFMRASAIAPSGLEGFPAGYSFRRQQVGMKASAAAGGDGFRFAWLAEGEGTARYRFQLFAEGRDALPLVDEPGLAQTALTIANLAPGAYRWRVGVIQTVADGSAEVWTPLDKLVVGD